MIRSNHYDAAFEAYLQEKKTAYVAVDESRRAVLADVSLKSMDFIVYAPGKTNLLIDVKGRKRLPGRQFENWAPREDIGALQRWEQVFGAGFRGLFVFAYVASENPDLTAATSVVDFRGNRYHFYGIWLDDYRQAMQQRSPRWQTVWLPAASYRKFRFPLGELWSNDAQTVIPAPSAVATAC